VWLFGVIVHSDCKEREIIHKALKEVTHVSLLENCTFDPSCDRAFEYSTLEADIRGAITNIKNPMSGHIVADSIGSVTIDENIKAPADCVIEVREK